MKEQFRVVRAKTPSGVEHVCILINGRLVADMPAETAKLAAASLMSVAKLIENDANPQKTIMDQAILNRAGVKLGLSNNAKIAKEAIKEAQWNTQLRKYMPKASSVASAEILGIPTILTGK